MSAGGLWKLLGVSICAAVVLGGLLRTRTPGPESEPKPEPKPGTTAAASAATDDVVLRRAPDGHFWAEAEVNGRPVRFLIDTGASHVTLSPADAERVGLRPLRDDFTLSVATANGSVPVAPVTLDSLDLGPLHVSGVAAVVHGAALPQSLLGMSFLNRLGGFAVEGDRLILRP